MLSKDQQNRHRSQEIQVGGNLTWQETPTHERNFATKTTNGNGALQRSIDWWSPASAERCPCIPSQYFVLLSEFRVPASHFFIQFIALHRLQRLIIVTSPHK